MNMEYFNKVMNKRIFHPWNGKSSSYLIVPNYFLLLEHFYCTSSPGLGMSGETDSSKSASS